MAIAISGARGLIGGALTDALAADGVPVVRLVRRPARSADEVSWDPQQRAVDLRALARHDVSAVVHLAGAGIGDKRWTPEYKAEIHNSRVWGTETIARAVADLPGKPPLICASAIGIYGDTGRRVVDETDGPGVGFLADVVRDWEAAAAPAREAGVRVAHARTGLVVARKGGAFAQLLPIFKAGLGGRLGSGRQWWSFIALTDQIRALRFLVDRDIAGPVNVVAPNPITNTEAMKALGEVLHRPSLFPVPKVAVRVVAGEIAGDVMSGQGVLPAVLEGAGFTWEYPEIHAALRAELLS